MQQDDERYLECWRRYRRVRKNALICLALVPVVGTIGTVFDLPPPIGVAAVAVLALTANRMILLLCPRCGNKFFRYGRLSDNCGRCQLPLWADSTGHVFKEFAPRANRPLRRL